MIEEKNLEPQRLLLLLWGIIRTVGFLVMHMLPRTERGMGQQ